MPCLGREWPLPVRSARRCIRGWSYVAAAADGIARPRVERRGWLSPAWHAPKAERCATCHAIADAGEMTLLPRIPGPSHVAIGLGPSLRRAALPRPARVGDVYFARILASGWCWHTRRHSRCARCCLVPPADLLGTRCRRLPRLAERRVARNRRFVFCLFAPTATPTTVKRVPAGVRSRHGAARSSSGV